jgi:nucleoside-diphosphate-sugar epimerase
MSPGDQVLDLLYIDDVICASREQLSCSKAAGLRVLKIYLLAASEQKSLKEVVQLYQNLAGITLPIFWGGRPYREREVMQPWNQGKILPGWKPEIGLTEGIRRILAQKQVSD